MSEPAAAPAPALGRLLEGKTAIVTGSTAGIGKAIAKAYVAAGAFVFINGRSASTVDAVVAELGPSTSGVVANIATKEGCDALFATVEATGREVSILVCNMGVFNTGDFFTYTDEQWLEYFTTNVLSTVRMCRHYLKPMLEREDGRVIIVSSEAGLRPIPDMIPYCSTKAMQINIARGLAELTKGKKGVTVNSLLPGPTATEGVGSFLDGIVAQGGGTSREDAATNYFKSREPTSLLQRFLEVEEVANVATFLASPLASGINGAAQLVEGGIIRHI